MDCPKDDVVSKSAPSSIFRFQDNRNANTELSGGTFGAHRNPKAPKIPPFTSQKSASCGVIPMSTRPLPKPLLPPPRPVQKPHKRRNITSTFRKSAHVTLVDLRRAFKPEAVQYIIYNITQSQALQYNKTRGLTCDDINWKYIRIVLPSWKAKDEIWAVGTNGVEYSCVKREIAKNPIFGLQKSFMPTWVRAQFHIGSFETYYYEELLKTPITSTSVEGWMVTKHPITGAIIDIT